jgi:predicted metal-dependent enzyme (double-stranded beta helix superfamily)
MERFEVFCSQIRKMISQEKSVFHRIESGRELVAELTSRPDWFCEYLEKMISHRVPAYRERCGIWQNEYTLYRSPDKLFVVFAYVWDARQEDFIHDHNAWGIIGTLFGKMGEKKYERLDDGTREGFCEIRETARGVFGPGETTPVLPLNKGIHALDNPTDEIAVTVNVYGKIIDRGYIQFFDLVKKTVRRVFPAHTLKEILAVKALAAIDPPRAGGVLREALNTSQPSALRQEYETTLQRLRT